MGGIFLNTIERKELKGELKYKDTVILTYQIQYPEITSSPYESGRKVFNQYNRQRALLLENRVKTQLYQDAKDLYDYNTANGYPVMVYEIVSQFTLTYQQGSIISLYNDQYEFTGGAHGNTIQTSQTWDLSLCQMLPLSYFYPDNPYYLLDILQVIYAEIKRQNESGENQYFENYCELVLETFRFENYYLTHTAIAIYFQQYDIAPYSSGIPVFFIPYP